MIIKSKVDIRNILENGRRLGEILEKLSLMCVPGISSGEINGVAEKMILAAGGRPAFKGYQTGGADRRPFPATICASFNEELVHCIPGNRILKDGDIFSIDIGMCWPDQKNKKTKKQENKKERSVFTDTAMTVIVGQVSEKVQKLVQVTQQSLEEGIKAAQPGNSVAAIGRAVETYVRSMGKYGIVRNLVGHGVGHKVHEDPQIPNYYDPKLEKIILQPGMVVALEPMISLGDWKIETAEDGWTIRTQDKSLCAHFEHTVVITEKGNVVATRRPGERQ